MKLSHYMKTIIVIKKKSFAIERKDMVVARKQCF